MEHEHEEEEQEHENRHVQGQEGQGQEVRGHEQWQKEQSQDGQEQVKEQEFGKGMVKIQGEWKQNEYGQNHRQVQNLEMYETENKSDIGKIDLDEETYDLDL